MIRRSESYWIRGIWNVTAGWLNGFHSNHTNIMRNCWQWKARPPMVSLLAWFERTVQLLWGGTGTTNVPVLENNGEEFVIQHEIQHKRRKDRVDRKIHFFDCSFSNGQKKPFPINAFVQNVEIIKIWKKLWKCVAGKRKLWAIFPRVQHKFNTKATLCNLPYIRKNLETIMVSRFSLVENSGIEPLTSWLPEFNFFRCVYNVQLF